MDRAPPYVTARSWAIFDAKTSKFLFGKLESEWWEIASLTKLMVALTVIKVCEWLDIDYEKEMIRVEGECLNITGTSAKLWEGDHLTIKQLLYGLLLPSGNDAGYLLADYFGKLLFKSKKNQTEKVWSDYEDFEEDFNSSFSSTESMSNLIVNSKYLAKKS